MKSIKQQKRHKIYTIPKTRQEIEIGRFLAVVLHTIDPPAERYLCILSVDFTKETPNFCKTEAYKCFNNYFFI